MDEQELAFCKDVLLSAGLSLLEQESYSDSFKINHVSLSLSSLISSDNLTADWSSPLFMLLALVMAQGSALNSIANILWTSVPTAALKLMYVYAVLIPKVSFAVYPYRDISVKKFFDENVQHIQQLFQTNVSRLEEIPIENLKVSQLIYLQRMLPSNPAYASFNFVIKIGKLIWDELFNSNNTKDRNSYRNYEGEYAYIKWLGDYVLNLSSENQSFFLEELMPRVNYKHKREFSHLLVAIIASEDMNPRYNAFWGLWSLLRNYLLSDFERTYQSKQLISGDHATDYGLGNVLAEYLLAGPYWKEGVTVWHSLREDSATFYKTISIRMGAHPAVLYSIGRLLNGIGTQVFFENGIEWLADIVSRNPQLRKTTLPMNTIYYLEEYMYRYVYKHLYSFKFDPLHKRQVLDVLNFLVDIGSSFGFLLREDVI